MQTKARLGHLAQVTSVVKLEGLEQYEIAALVAVAQQIDRPEDGISAYRVREDMGNAGFTKIAATLGLRALLDKDMLSQFEDRDYDGTPFTAYRVTDRGMSWLLTNQASLTLTERSPRTLS